MLMTTLFTSTTGCALCHSVLSQAVETESLLLDEVKTLVVITNGITVCGRVSTLTVHAQTVFISCVRLVTCGMSTGMKGMVNQSVTGD